MGRFGRSLEEWEAWLSARVGGIDLLGEIVINEAERLEMGRQLGNVLSANGITRAVRLFRSKYPCTFAEFLVAQGVYGYEGGNYWDDVRQSLDVILDTNDTRRLGQLFEEILEDLRLPLFPEARSSSFRYVTLILMHGGIPNYCLPDFFDNVLQPTVTKLEYAELDAEELLEVILRSATVQQFTDKPVLRFLGYGEQVAVDFMQRSREVAKHYLEFGLMPNLYEVGLPERIVSAYHDWVLEQSEERFQRETGERLRLRRPNIILDPWGEGLTLLLPEQPVPASHAQSQFEWSVKAGDVEPFTLSTRIRRVGFDRLTQEHNVLLDAPAASYQASLLIDGQCKRTWHFNGIDQNCPFLVFSPEDGTLIRRTRLLPARDVWLLFPQELVLDISGKAQILEDLPILPGAWSDYRVQAIDLAAAERVILRRVTEAVCQVSVFTNEQVAQPSLVGGNPLQIYRELGRLPVYVGAPPTLHIPLIGRQAVLDELSRWRITIYNKWPAEPDINRSVRLSELTSAITIVDTAAVVALADESLLGSAPIGNYTVQIRGPIGHDAEFALRIVPHLHLEGVSHPHIPDPLQPSDEVKILIEVGETEIIEYLGDSKAVWLKTVGRGQYTLAAEGSESSVEVNVVRPQAHSEPVRVPIRIPIRQLRWMLGGLSPGLSVGEWSNQILKQSYEALYQADQPFLLISVPSELPGIRIQLNLVDDDGQMLQSSLTLESFHRYQQTWRFELTGFKDSIRNSPAPRVKFQLHIWGLSDELNPISLDILRITRQLDIREVATDIYQRDDWVYLRLTWREGTRLRNRRARLWPLWQPWRSPVWLSIPDDKEGEIVTKASTRSLPPGKYRVELYIDDPWAPDTLSPSPPSANSKEVRDIYLASAQERLAQLANAPDQFAVHLEQAIIQWDIGQVDQARQQYTQCLSHLDEDTVTLPHILALCALVREGGDNNTLTALRMKLFAPPRIMHWVAAHNEGQISGSDFEAYLGQLPQHVCLPVETCEILLNLAHEPSRLYAAQQLIEQAVPSGVYAVLNWNKSAALSDLDAIRLFEVNPEFAVDVLVGIGSDPTSLRILEKMGNILQSNIPVVREGSWVRSPAGWAQIDRIIDPQTQEPVKSFIRGTGAYQLHATLRPGHDAEPIVIDEEKGTLEFTDTQRLNCCTLCRHFACNAEHRTDWLYYYHVPAAHSGKGAGFRQSGPDLALNDPISFTNRAPRNQLI